MINSVNDILSERALSKLLDLDLQGERSRIISHWISLGLPCIELSNKRYFFAPRVIEFFLQQFKGSETNL